eukprot:2432634-Rhodomonas_salina.1
MADEKLDLRRRAMAVKKSYRNLTAKKSNGSEEELSKLDCEEDQWQMRDLIWKSYGSEEELSKLGCEEEQWQMRDLICEEEQWQ